MLGSFVLSKDSLLQPSCTLLLLVREQVLVHRFDLITVSDNARAPRAFSTRSSWPVLRWKLPLPGPQVAEVCTAQTSLKTRVPRFSYEQKLRLYFVDQGAGPANLASWPTLLGCVEGLVTYPARRPVRAPVCVPLFALNRTVSYRAIFNVLATLESNFSGRVSYVLPNYQCLNR